MSKASGNVEHSKTFETMTVYERMLAGYKEHNIQAHCEVAQQITLAGLYRGGFFDKAAFYGGTCLRIFHGLQRYSEDMDFTLLAPDPQFNFKKYFPAIIREFEAVGRQVTIEKKDKRTFGRVESAFLKDTTDVYNLSFQTEKGIKIKIEVDIDPPLRFDTEQRLSLMPFSFMTRTLTLPSLFAGKMHALLFRNWKNRVKGRDWYDFEWYVRNRIPLDFNHLHERIVQFNGRDVSKSSFVEMLKDKLASTDIRQVKADVENFIINPEELEIWSNDYFLQLAGMIDFRDETR